MGKIMAVCISKVKGVRKENLGSAMLIAGHGISGDAHAGSWHRQISLLSNARIEEFNAHGANVSYGEFGENLVVDDIDFRGLPVGTRLLSGDVVLEITQLGKECHNGCEIFQRMGDCIMPREGVFAVVIHGGEIKIGDEMYVEG